MSRTKNTVVWLGWRKQETFRNFPSFETTKPENSRRDAVSLSFVCVWSREEFSSLGMTRKQERNFNLEFLGLLQHSTLRLSHRSARSSLMSDPLPIPILLHWLNLFLLLLTSFLTDQIRAVLTKPASLEAWQICLWRHSLLIRSPLTKSDLNYLNLLHWALTD